MKKKTVLMAGGGTGGHLYPAVAIARAMQDEIPGVDIHFVGSPQGLETKIVPREGFPLHLMPIGKLNRHAGMWKTVLGLPWAFIKALWLLLKLRPSLIVGVGGYASAPAVFVGSLLGFKTSIWEPNAVAGLANRWLARFVDEVMVVFQECASSFKAKSIIKVGMPVRATIEDHKAERPSFNGDRPLQILVFGASQGARAINDLISTWLTQKNARAGGLKIVHQTGAADFKRMQNIYRGHDLPQLEVYEYLHDMEMRYAWADLVVCRSGVSTLAELAALAKPAILVPLPTSADDHQRKNAEVLVKAGAAQMILQPELTVERFEQEIMAIRQDPKKLNKMAENISQFHSPKAAYSIARHLKQLMGGDKVSDT